MNIQKLRNIFDKFSLLKNREVSIQKFMFFKNSRYEIVLDTSNISNQDSDKLLNYLNIVLKAIKVKMLEEIKEEEKLTAKAYREILKEELAEE